MPLAKPTLILIAFVFVFYVAYRRGGRCALVFTVGFLLTAWILVLYNTVCFGGPFRTGYESGLHLVGGEVRVFDLTSRPFMSNNLLKTVPGLTLILLLTQPVLAASAVGLVKDRRGELVVISASFIILLLAYGIRFDSIGGWCWSWRYMLPLIPLLALPAAIAYDRGFVSEKTVWCLFTVSLYLTLLSHAPITWHIFTGSPFVKLMNYGSGII